MNNLSAIFCVEFPQVQFIDLSEQVVKVAVIVTSIHLNFLSQLSLAFSYKQVDFSGFDAN